MPKNLTIAISDELAKEMETMPEINWSEVCRQAISNYIDEKKAKRKGELTRELETYLSPKLTQLEEEKERIKKAEIERFTKKWGEPDSVHPDIEPPYVNIFKTYAVEHEGQTLAELEISNSRLSAKRTVDFVEKGLGKYDINNYKKVEPVIDFFKSKGFTIAEDYLIQDQVMYYVLKTYGSQGRERARELAERGYSYHGLFAADKEDRVFIAYREIKTK